MDKDYWERRKFIEFCFANEAEIVRACWEKRLDPNIPKSIGHGSGISKPTEMQAIKNSLPLDFVTVKKTAIYTPELWLRLVTITKAEYNYKQGGILYKLKYQQDFLRAKVMKEMKISKTRYHQLIIEIINFAMNKAELNNLRYGIVGVSKKE